MNVFWRQEPLSEEEFKLLTYLGEAHQASAFRDNVSSHAVKEAARGSGDYSKAIMAALCTMGNVHAPLLATAQLICTPPEMIEDAVKNGHSIPGWGSSFSKDGIDPLWTKVESQIRAMNVDLAKTIDRITEILHKHGKMVQPNPSLFTVATAMIVNMPPTLVPYLFISSRLQAWSVLFYSALMKTESQGGA